MLTEPSTPRDARWVWSNVYGTARTILAFGTLITLLLTPGDILFGPAQGIYPGPRCDGPAAVGFFCVLPGGVDLLQPVAVCLLLVVASGWRPRFTGVLHWWIAFGLNSSAIALEGGDSVAANLTLLLVPITLLDRRVWHWGAPQSAPETSPAYRIASSAWFMIRLQVAFIYLHSAIAKLGVTEWADGTALYYVLTDGMFGAPAWARDVLDPLLGQALVVVALTWGTLVVEMGLGAAILMPYRVRQIAMKAGATFHALIAVTLGLLTFALAMVAAVILYLRLPTHELRVRLPWATAIAGRFHRVARQPSET